MILSSRLHHYFEWMKTFRLMIPKNLKRNIAKDFLKPRLLQC